MSNPEETITMFAAKPIWFSWILLVLIALIGPSQAYPCPSSKDAVTQRSLPMLIHNGFIRLAFHSSTRAGNTIYIDGGEINFYGSDGASGTETVTLNTTLTIDLSDSWDTSSMQYGSIVNDPSVPILDHGASWSSADARSIFTFGGARSAVPYSPTISSVKIWKYDGAQWQGLTNQNPASPTLNDARPALAANTYGNGMAYMLGGFKGNGPAPWWPLPGMLTYNMSSNNWTNESTASLTPFGVIGGSLTYIPSFGKEGVLVAMGGEYSGPGAWMETPSNLIPFSNISIWDINSKTWYWQTATQNTNIADMPSAATMFCTAGAAGGNGTYEIFMYGGHSDAFVLSSQTPSASDMTAQQGFKNVYVLSLPGFVWTQVSSTGSTARTGHTCEVIGNRQMLSIGGLNPAFDLTAARYSPDGFIQGLGIFDMVDLNWRTTYDSKAATYETPELIGSWYKSSAAASIQWSSPNVQALFDPRSSNSASTNPAPEIQPPKTNVVIPAVSGAVIGAALVAGIGIFCWHRYRKEHKPKTTQEPCSECKDVLTNDIREHLDEARESYLRQRGVFINHYSSDVEPINVLSSTPAPAPDTNKPLPVIENVAYPTPIAVSDDSALTFSHTMQTSEQPGQYTSELGLPLERYPRTPYRMDICCRSGSTSREVQTSPIMEADHAYPRASDSTMRTLVQKSPEQTHSAVRTSSRMVNNRTTNRPRDDASSWYSNSSGEGYRPGSDDYAEMNYEMVRPEEQEDILDERSEDQSRQKHELE